MDTIKQGVDSLSLIAKLNLDRILFLATIGAALFLAGYLMTL